MFKGVLENLQYTAVMLFVACIHILPISLQLLILLALIRSILWIKPHYRKIGVRNLLRAFPEKSDTARNAILFKSDNSIARLIIDFLRMPSIDLRKAKLHFNFPLIKRLDEIKESGVPILYATGHLGSFELLAHYLAIMGHPMSFVVRKFKHAKLDLWWTAKREANGNKVIARVGALKGLLKALKSKRNAAVLFDQNVTRDHAEFVNWFGHPAATTRVVALAALRTQPRVIVISMHHVADDNYQINAKECDFDMLYQNTELSNESKVTQITQVISDEYQEMIRANPEEWFWMHRRWKTAAKDEQENFYKDM